MSIFIGISEIARQTAALPKVNNTLVATDLTIPIAANQRMTGTFFCPLSVAGAASGAQFQLVVPAGGTLYQLQYQILNGVTPAVAVTDIFLASAAFSNALANIGDHCASGIFSIANGATAGSITMQFAQLVTDAAAATLLAGAFMQVTKF